MALRDDIKTSTLVIIGALSCLVIYETILFSEVLYWGLYQEQVKKKDYSQRPVELDTLVAAQTAKLHEYRWVDPDKKIVAIPIERAMELVVMETSASVPRLPEQVGAP